MVTLKNGIRYHDQYGDSYVKWELVKADMRDIESEIETNHRLWARQCNHSHDCCGCVSKSEAYVKRYANGKALVVQSYVRNV
jgi:hypothetical protein